MTRRDPWRRRRCIAAAIAVGAAGVVAGCSLALPAASRGDQNGDGGADRRDPRRVAIWIRLSEPAVAAPPAVDPEARQRRRLAVEAQQTAVQQRLEAIGATVTARVAIALNAVAAEVPHDEVDAIRRWPGVVAVSPVVHRHAVHEPPAAIAPEPRAPSR